MPIPFPQPPKPVSTTGGATTYDNRDQLWVKDRQSWVIEQERMRRQQGLYAIGEYAIFWLMWHEEDYQHGLVAKCSRCFGEGSDVPFDLDARISAVYQQPVQNRCPFCFGTTYEGGYKAIIFRPASFTDYDEDEQKQERGITNPTSLLVQSTTDFRVRTNDYVGRANGDRFQLRVPTRVTARTGFGTPTQLDDAIGYNLAEANQEDRTSVAYDLPPTDWKVLQDLLTPDRYRPVDLSAHEEIRADLIPAFNP